MILPVYLLFVFGAVVAAFAVLAIYHRQHRRPLITCPETLKPARIEVDRRHELYTLMRGIKETRLKSCTRWPERADCDQDCVVQVEAGPAVIERILGKWYDKRNCAICAMPLVQYDYQRGRAAALNRDGTFLELRDMNWNEFPMSLKDLEPICWKCHEKELIRRRDSRVSVV
ncbi:MAG TPA: hypothetical protein VD837_14235 [Terriglobales bacterium]|nr:hypothetical protein [Terriglobales bacterium]